MINHLNTIEELQVELEALKKCHVEEYRPFGNNKQHSKTNDKTQLGDQPIIWKETKVSRTHLTPLVCSRLVRYKDS